MLKRTRDEKKTESKENTDKYSGILITKYSIKKIDGKYKVTLPNVEDEEFLDEIIIKNNINMFVENLQDVLENES